MRDQLSDEKREIFLSEETKKSYFSTRKRSTGFKSGALNLVRGDNGGFVNIGKKNDRLDLQELLSKYDNIAKSRDQYTTEMREPFEATVEF